MSYSTQSCQLHNGMWNVTVCVGCIDSATNSVHTSVHIVFLKENLVTPLDHPTIVYYTVYTKLHTNFHSDVFRHLLIPPSEISVHSADVLRRKLQWIELPEDGIG